MIPPEWETERAAMLDNAKLKPGLKVLWFATGKDDFLLGTTKATVEMLKKHHFEPVFKGNRRRTHLAELARLFE